LGGNSILMLQLRIKLESMLHTRFSYRMLFDLKTVAEQALHIELLRIQEFANRTEAEAFDI
jgi:hypothetical protein